MRDPRKRSLISPITADEIVDAPAIIQCASFTPYFCRLFRATVDLKTMAEHFNAILAHPHGPGLGAFDLSNDTKADDLIAFCRNPVFSRAYAALISSLDAPIPRLRGLIENLVSVYGSRRTLFSVVILLDQFEELFTRFVDLGSIAPQRQMGLPDWRLKYEFFEQLCELYVIKPNGAAQPGDPLPIRYVISMRSEYVAQLDPIRVFAPELDVASFRLELLGPEDTQQAIRAPAREYGFDYTEDCYQAIAQELTKEERFVEPAHVQIVCEKLWTEQGSKLAEEAERFGESMAADGRREIGIELYRDRLHGAAGIMRAFLRDFLDALDEPARLETLELLEPLITSGGTRNIMERSFLIASPFRSRMRREQLLANLVARTIVRVETRLGGQFVEITHEFLIPPIREAMQKHLYADEDYTRSRASLRALAQLQQSYAGSKTYPHITSTDFQLLNRFRDRFEWNDWGVAVMFRQAVRLGIPYEETRHWAHWFRQSAPALAVQDEATAGDRAEDAAVRIVREDLASQDSWGRRNSLKALAALNSNEAAELLVTAALDTADHEFRDAAIAELVHLGDGVSTFAARYLGRELRDPAKASGIYALLGRLRRAGSPVKVSLPDRRLLLGLSLFSQLFPKKKRHPWTRSFKAALTGGTIFGLVLAATGFALLLILANSIWKPSKTPETSDIYGNNFTFFGISLFSLVVTSVCVMLLVPLVTRRASPFPLHYDSKLGRASEALWAAVGALYLFVPYSVLTIGGFLFSLWESPTEIWSAVPVAALGIFAVFLGIVVAAAIPMAAVRCGTVMVRTPAGSAAGRLWRAALGAVFGLIAIVPMFAIAEMFIGGSIPDATTLVGLVLPVLPALTGLSNAYVSIDDEDVVKA